MRGSGGGEETGVTHHLVGAVIGWASTGSACLRLLQVMRNGQRHGPFDLGDDAREAMLAQAVLEHEQDVPARDDAGDAVWLQAGGGQPRRDDAPITVDPYHRLRESGEDGGRQERRAGIELDVGGPAADLAQSPEDQTTGREAVVDRLDPERQRRTGSLAGHGAVDGGPSAVMGLRRGCRPDGE